MHGGGIDDEELLAAWSDYRRPLLRLAAGILKDPAAAEDAVQETFLRLAFQASGSIGDVRGWLIVVVTRLCIDHLRSATRRREAPTGDDIDLDASTLQRASDDPADLVSAVDDLRHAVAVLLTRLSPSEQAAFLLHDVFQMPFEQVADALQRSPEACRQLASRARRALDVAREEAPTAPAADVATITERFVAACESGDLDALLDVMNPDAVGVADFGKLLPKRTLRGRVRIADRLRRLFSHHRFSLVPVELDTGSAVVVVRRRDLRLIGTIHLELDRSSITHLEATNRPNALATLGNAAPPTIGGG
jgi:RNA polymerase sigma-70 factor (ECF subfamily)